MKSLIDFSQQVLQDMGDWCGVSTSRDWKTVAARTEHEGLSFLTIALPQFARDVETSLAAGFVADSAFPGYARTQGLPRFLGGFLQLVFSRTDGTLLDVPSITAIRALRQFCLAFAKISIPCTPSRERKAMESYVKCERDVARWNSEDHSSELSLLTQASGVLFSDLFSTLDRKVFDGELVPKHGPGSTADHVSGNSKFHIRGWSTRLDAVFPIADWVIPSVKHWDYLDRVDIVEPGAEMPVRVISVPKTQKTPRIIALEPHYVQYAQQAVKEAVYDYVERDDILSAFIGFDDQTPNRVLARKGSSDGSLATLDLSEASDRVSVQHVAALLARHSLSREAVMACRTTKAEVPGHGVIPLTKFASMGSALCFPFEAMVFLAITLIAIAEVRRVQLDQSLVRQMVGQVRVYGDDIIVPVDCAPAVMSRLEDFGLRVNVHKSFSTGWFRESCGGDYYRGEWVTPVRVRSVFPASRKHAHDIASTVSLRNQLYELGCERSVNYLDALLKPFLPVWPKVPVGHASLGRWTYSPVTGERVHAGYQVPLVRVPVLQSRPPKDSLGGVGGLMKFFLRRGTLPLEKEAFMRAGRPLSARIVTRWTAV